jgi:putative ABC transport system permease protein
MTVRLALRTLFKTPFVTGVAILSLALGIGANTAIYSVFDQLLRRPLPVPEPNRLVNLEAPPPKPGNTSCNQAGDCDRVFSYPMFRDLERAQSVFTGIAAHCLFGANVAARGQTLSGDGLFISGSYFSTLQLKPAIGRLLGPDDDKTPGEAHVAVLSHAYWTTRFGQDREILNQPITVNGQPMTVIGVGPEGFDGTTLGAKPVVFVPLTMRDIFQPGARISTFENRRSYWAYLFARLKPGVTIEQARTALNGPYQSILNEVEAPLQVAMSDQTMAKFRERQVLLVPGERGQSGIDRDARTPLILLLSVTALVLLIACANIANLLLARSAARAGEMAVRLSIGASRRHLITQLLIESCLLASFGGVGGLLVAQWTLKVLTAMLPPEAAATTQLHLDWGILPVTAAVTLGTGFLFGIFPALHSTRPDLIASIKGQAGQPSGARAAARFRTVLATSQVALSMALLVAAGLFMKSLVNISRVELGLNPDNVVMFRVAPVFNGYKPERSRQFFQDLEHVLAAQPGVVSVSGSSVPLLSGSNNNNDVLVEGFQAGLDTNVSSRFTRVGPGYLRTLGMRLLSGREFSEADGNGAPKVAIVNEAFLKKFNLGPDAVGRHMGMKSDNRLDIEIVGIAANAKYSQVKQEMLPTYFLPYRQADVGLMTYYVRTSSNMDALMGSIRREVMKLDPNLPVDQLKTLPDQIQQNVFLDRFITILSTAFAVLATLLAAIGLYGVLAYTVSQRTKEIGLRMALGAQPQRVRGMVLKQVALMVAIGGTLGLTTAVWVGSVASALLFQMKGWDPIVLVSAAIGLTFVALAAGFVPANRAAHIDPMRALRYE